MKALIKAVEIVEVATRRLKKNLLRKNDEQFRQLEKWYEEDPFDLKRSRFDFLNSNSIVFDLGGYTGQWTSDIVARYNCKVFVFEPVQQYAQLIKERFVQNQNVRVVKKGLGPKNSTALIKIDKFASRISQDLKNGQGEEIEIEEFNFFLEREKIRSIDLVKINIEGGEYELLEHLLSTGTVKEINGLLIQFHNFIDNHLSRRIAIQEKLASTHTKVFDYPYVWEMWIKK